MTRIVGEKSNDLQSVVGPGCVARLECHPVHQTVAGSIPDQGQYPGCRFNPLLRRVQESTN